MSLKHLGLLQSPVELQFFLGWELAPLSNEDFSLLVLTALMDCCHPAESACSTLLTCCHWFRSLHVPFETSAHEVRSTRNTGVTAKAASWPIPSCCFRSVWGNGINTKPRKNNCTIGESRTVSIPKTVGSLSNRILPQDFKKWSFSVLFLGKESF